MWNRKVNFIIFSEALYTKISSILTESKAILVVSLMTRSIFVNRVLFYKILKFLPGCIILTLLIIDSLPLIEFVTSRNKTQSRLQFYPYQLATDCYIKLSAHWSIFEHTNAIMPELLNGCFITRNQVYIKDTYIRVHIHTWYTSLCGNYISIPSQNARR